LIGVAGTGRFLCESIAFGAGNNFGQKITSATLRNLIRSDTGEQCGHVLDYVSASQIPSHMVGVGVDSAHSILARDMSGP